MCDSIAETPAPPIKVVVAPLGPKNTVGYEPIRVVVQEVSPSDDGAIHGLDPPVPGDTIQEPKHLADSQAAQAKLLKTSYLSRSRILL